jgi:hypothetical protein
MQGRKRENLLKKIIAVSSNQGLIQVAFDDSNKKKNYIYISLYNFLCLT